MGSDRVIRGLSLPHGPQEVAIGHHKVPWKGCQECRGGGIIVSDESGICQGCFPVIGDVRAKPRQIATFLAFPDDARLELSSTPAPNVVTKKPPSASVLGPRNWLFASQPASALTPARRRLRPASSARQVARAVVKCLSVAAKPLRVAR